MLLSETIPKIGQPLSSQLSLHVNRALVLAIVQEIAWIVSWRDIAAKPLGLQVMLLRQSQECEDLRDSPKVASDVPGLSRLQGN